MIKITEKYYLDWDKFQFILKQKSVPKDKKKDPTYRSIGFFPNISDLINQLAYLQILDNDAVETLKDMGYIMKTFKPIKEVDKIMKQLRIENENLKNKLKTYEEE